MLPFVRRLCRCVRGTTATVEAGAALGNGDLDDTPLLLPFVDPLPRFAAYLIAITHELRKPSGPDANRRTVEKK